MYIKKSVLIVISILLVVATAVGTIMLVNPFGAFNFLDFVKFGVGVNALKDYYYEDLESEKLVDGALLGAAYSTEDPYTLYMNKQEAESFLENIESDDYAGVGLYIANDTETGNITVISPLSGSPAEEAGIVSGDRILEVDGKTIEGRSIDQIAADMKGKEGTKVKLKILKATSGETVEVTITRAIIQRETVVSKMADKKTGYMQITQFGVNTYDEFRKHFNSLVEQKMQQLVIDLRNNPGGYMEIAVEIADAFLDKGEIVYTLNKDGDKRDYMANEGKTEVEMVILTNGGTASASEVLVGALRDYNLATIVGEKTFGKGVTQIPYEFWDGSIMKITDSRYYTPSGVCIDKEGIEPDVEVKMSAEKAARISELSLDEDEQLKAAVEILYRD